MTIQQTRLDTTMLVHRLHSRRSWLLHTLALAFLSFIVSGIDQSASAQTLRELWQREKAPRAKSALPSKRGNRVKRSESKRSNSSKTRVPRNTAKRPAPVHALPAADKPDGPAAGAPTSQPAGASPAPITAVPATSALDSQTESLKALVSKAAGPVSAARLFDGDPGDLIVLVNETSSAPNARRLLSGDVSFLGSRAQVCGAGPEPLEEPLDRYVQTDLRHSFRSLAFADPLITHTPCRSGAAVDLVIVRRGGLHDHVQVGKSIAEAVARRRYSVLHVVSISPYQFLKSSVAALQRSNADGILNGQLTGVGTLILADGRQDRLCVSNSTDTEVAREIATELRDRTLFERRWQAHPEIWAGQPDDVFITAKRSGCQYVVGDISLLRAMMLGFQRDAVKFSVSSVLLPSTSISEIVERVTEKRRTAALKRDAELAESARRREEERNEAQRRYEAEQRRLQALKTRTEEEKRLAEIKRRNDEEARRKEVERNRRLVASRAQTVVDSLETRLRRHMASVDSEVKDLARRASLGDVPSDVDLRRQRALVEDERVSKLFPDWAAWFSDRVKEEWEFGPTRASIEDYGQAKWKERIIDAIAVRVEFPMLNRAIGDRRTFCVVFLWINDEEFSFYREPRSYDCESHSSKFAVWTAQNEFNSYWRVSIE